MWDSPFPQILVRWRRIVPVGRGSVPLRLAWEQIKTVSRDRYLSTVKAFEGKNDPWESRFAVAFLVFSQPPAKGSTSVKRGSVVYIIL